MKRTSYAGVLRLSACRRGRRIEDLVEEDVLGTDLALGAAGTGGEWRPTGARVSVSGIEDRLVLVAEHVDADVPLGGEHPPDPVAVRVGQDVRWLAFVVVDPGLGPRERLRPTAVRRTAVEPNAALLVPDLPPVVAGLVAVPDDLLELGLDAAREVLPLGDPGLEDRVDGIRHERVAVEEVGLALDIAARRLPVRAAVTEARGAEARVDSDLAKRQVPPEPRPRRAVS